MVVYNYECGNCGEQLKVRQKITDKSLERCLKCNSLDFYRLIGNMDYVCKIKGFYGKGK